MNNDRNFVIPVELAREASWRKAMPIISGPVGRPATQSGGLGDE